MPETPTLTAEQRDLAGVLAEHRYRDVLGDYELAPFYKHFGCSCGWEQNIAGMSGWRSWVAAHEAHVADALSPRIARMVADAEQRGRAEVSAVLEAVLAECERRIGREPDRVLEFWVQRVRAALTDPARSAGDDDAALALPPHAPASRPRRLRAARQGRVDVRQLRRGGGMTTHWPTNPTVGVHLGRVEDCDECSRIVLPEPVETAMPWRGSCWLCGGPDARHCVLDAVQDMVRAGDSVADVAYDYDLPESVVEYIAEHWVQDGETWELRA